MATRLTNNTVAEEAFARLERAMGQLAEAALNVRRTAALSDALAQRALLSLAVSARRR